MLKIICETSSKHWRLIFYGQDTTRNVVGSDFLGCFNTNKNPKMLVERESTRTVIFKKICARFSTSSRGGRSPRGKTEHNYGKSQFRVNKKVSVSRFKDTYFPSANHNQWWAKNARNLSLLRKRQGIICHDSEIKFINRTTTIWPEMNFFNSFFTINCQRKTKKKLQHNTKNTILQ